MQTFPNQKVIHIQKKTYNRDFLQVGVDEWQKAVRLMSPSAFKLYLYLAGNRDGFDLALSFEAVKERLNIGKTSYHDAVRELEKNGYLQHTKGNVYNFATTPHDTSESIPIIRTADEEPVRKSGIEGSENRTEYTEKTETICQKNGIEINKQDNINNKTDNGLSDILKKRIEETVGIDVGKNTVEAILDITGTAPDEDVIIDILEHYASVFSECEKSGGYRFTMLKNKLQEHYMPLIEEKKNRQWVREVEASRRKQEQEFMLPPDVQKAMAKEQARKKREESERRVALFRDAFVEKEVSEKENEKAGYEEISDASVEYLHKILSEMTGKPIEYFKLENDELVW